MAVMPGPKAVRIELSEGERAGLEARLRRRKVARGDALRAEIVLLAAEGLSNLAITERLGIARMTAATWRRRFAERRLDGLADEPRPGAPRTVTDEKVAEVVTATLETLPAGRTHWSSRGMAKAAGLAPSTVQRIWKAFSLQPHRSETFKLSADPLFVEKVRDIVGLYLSPPERALVLCVDEKSQIQALDRTQPLLPLRPGQAERRTHDYKRHGTTSLFAALDVKAGTVIGKCMPRHRAQEFRRFLDTVEKNVPGDLDIHVVMDNASSHKTKLIRGWFAKRPRWHVHYTPTSLIPFGTQPWINQVERFFALLTEQQIRRGVHRSTAELEAAITAYIDAHNADPKPFCWIKTADDILASIQRFCQRTIAVQVQCG
jgi:transposase